MTGCPDPEAHEAHMAINDECPWCGASSQGPAPFDWRAPKRIRISPSVTLIYPSEEDTTS